MGCTSSHITDIVDSGSVSTLQQGKEDLPAQEQIENEQKPSMSMSSITNNNAILEIKKKKDPPIIPITGKEDVEGIASADTVGNEIATTGVTSQGNSAAGDQSSESSYDLSKVIDQETVERMPLQEGMQYGDEATTERRYDGEYTTYGNADGLEKKNYNGGDSFDDSFYQLPQQEKTKQLNSLLEEFCAVSEDSTDLNNLLPLLSKLFSVVLHERNAFILRQYYLLMTNHNSIDAFLRILYSNLSNSDCADLCVRLLLFFFINNDNSKENICVLLHYRGVSIIISALQAYADSDWLFQNIVCELFALMYTLSQSGSISPSPPSLEQFSSSFIDAGGLSVLSSFMQLISDHQLYAYLDSAATDKDPLHPLNNEQHANVKNLLYYMSYILASFSRFGSLGEGD